MDFSSALNDLNEDCLLEVLSHLDLPDLCAVADVCSRFRKIAKTSYVHVQSFPIFNPFDSKYRTYRLYDGDSYNQSLLQLSKVLRLFGRSIDEFEACTSGRFIPEELRPKYHRKVIELLIQYCSGFLKVLRLSKMDIPEEITLETRPLLESLERLIIPGANKFLREMLPFWCMNLRSLIICDVPAEDNYENIWRFRGLEKLVSLVFDNIHDLKNDDVKEILKCNPKLKLIFMKNCANIDHSSILQVIGEHGSVEVLYITKTPAIQPGSGLSVLNNEDFSRFNNLKCLTLDFCWDIPNIDEIISEIAREDAALETLHLGHFLVRNAERFVNAMLKLKKLEILGLRIVTGLTAIDVFSLCKYISLVNLEVNLRLTVENLLQLIRSAENLYLLRIRKYGWATHIYDGAAKVEIDDEVFQKMVELVEKRSKKTWIFLDTSIYSVNTSDHLARAHERTLSVIGGIYSMVDVKDPEFRKIYFKFVACI